VPQTSDYRTVRCRPQCDQGLAGSSLILGLSEFCAKNCKYCALFLPNFSTLKLSVALLYDHLCHSSIFVHAIPERLRGVITTRRYTNPRLPLPYLYLCTVCISIMFFTFWCCFILLFYYYKWFAVALAAISAKLRAILLYKMYKILHFLCCFVNSAHDGQFCARWPILRTQNRRILTSLVNTGLPIMTL